MATRKARVRRGIETYLKRDVEIRTVGGGSHRGYLAAVDAEFVYLIRDIGRDAMIPRATITAILDEERLANQV